MLDALEALEARIAELEAALAALYSAYVATLRAGRDRILALGGECDAVSVMERSDPALIAARTATPCDRMARARRIAGYCARCALLRAV
jgi:hypothetical protein